MMNFYKNTIINFMQEVNSECSDKDSVTDKLERLTKVDNNREINSWRNSLPALAKILKDCEHIHENSLIYLEYGLFLDNYRIDIILVSGKNVIVIELKQWSSVEKSTKANHLKQGQKEYLHPVFQAKEYLNHLKNSLLYDLKDIKFYYCSYLHNLATSDNQNNIYLKKYAYSKDNESDFKSFLSSKLFEEPNIDLVNKIDGQDFKDSPSSIDSFIQFLESQEDYYLIDKQSSIYMEVYKKILNGKERIFIINGGAGTGKTVVGLYLLKQFLLFNQKQIMEFNEIKNNEILDSYLTEGNLKALMPYTSKYSNIHNFHFLIESSFLNQVLKNKKYDSVSENKYKNKLLCIDHTYTIIQKAKNARIAEKHFKCLIIDEAHRMNIDTIESLFEISEKIILLMDDYQKVTNRGMSISDLLSKYPNFFPTIFQLTKQIRCRGYDDYQTWVFNLFYKEPTTFKNSKKFFVQVTDSPQDLEEKLSQQDGTKKLLAGFTWKWSIPNNDGSLVKDISINGWEKAWNKMPCEHLLKMKKKLEKDGATTNNLYQTINSYIEKNCNSENIHAYYEWYSKNDLEEVGCIHTSQGIEFDYVGIIIGSDITKYNSEGTKLHGYMNSDLITFWDISINENKEVVDINIVLNIYYTLMTRAKKGIYIYAIEQEVNKKLKELVDDSL